MALLTGVSLHREAAGAWGLGNLILSPPTKLLSQIPATPLNYGLTCEQPSHHEILISFKTTGQARLLCKEA